MLEMCQGPPHINKVKPYKSVLSFKVRLFIQSWKQREFVYLIYIYTKKKKKKQQPHIAPLKSGVQSHSPSPRSASISSVSSCFWWAAIRVKWADIPARFAPEIEPALVF